MCTNDFVNSRIDRIENVLFDRPDAAVIGISSSDTENSKPLLTIHLYGAQSDSQQFLNDPCRVTVNCLQLIYMSQRQPYNVQTNEASDSEHTKEVGVRKDIVTSNLASNEVLAEEVYDPGGGATSWRNDKLVPWETTRFITEKRPFVGP
jgi:hypothetical protein